MSADKYENVTDLIDVFQKFAKADWRKKRCGAVLKRAKFVCSFV